MIICSTLCTRRKAYVLEVWVSQACNPTVQRFSKLPFHYQEKQVFKLTNMFIQLSIIIINQAEDVLFTFETTT